MYKQISKKLNKREFWTEAEDNMLINLVNQYGATKWEKIAKHFQGLNF